MGLKFGVFDHIEPIPNQSLSQVYKDRLDQVEKFDKYGFYAYHLAEHHTPAVHSLAPSQNVFLAAAAQRTSRIHLCPTVYVLPLHHPLRLIEEICMLDHLSNGRLEFGVGRGGVMEAYFWGSDPDAEGNYAKYLETLEIIKLGLAGRNLTYSGKYYSFDDLPMRLEPSQSPYPPMWYMRNVETAAQQGMNSIIVGTLEGFEPNVRRYRQLWQKHQGPDFKSRNGDEPKIGLVAHLVLAETDEEAAELAAPAWDNYVWNLTTPRRLEAEKRGLTEYTSGPTGGIDRPAGLPDREADASFSQGRSKSKLINQQSVESQTSGINKKSTGFRVIAGSPQTINKYMDTYVETGANYFLCAFHFGNMEASVAEQSIDLFIREVMPRYA
jgi:alkanesulfonate monooxygenase SsuD/methylene tetrahydromethanopterin reductase-like flavin-dependent oxidoreductase (luciferase family)